MNVISKSTELLYDNDDYNVIIYVEDDKPFTEHSNVLKFRLSYFRKKLDAVNSIENNNRIINILDISAQIFEIILKWV